ncbi:MAG: cupredoxin domain-containing protein [Vicinamibacterales bacterium]
MTMSWPSAEARQAAEPRVIEVVAKRYSFEPAIIEVTEGEPIRLLVKSGDGVHGFQVKQFKIGKEIPRGTEAVVIDFTPNVAGRFPILCSEYCGDGHDDMRGTLVVAARAVHTP